MDLPTLATIYSPFFPETCFEPRAPVDMPVFYNALGYSIVIWALINALLRHLYPWPRSPKEKHLKNNTVFPYTRMRRSDEYAARVCSFLHALFSTVGCVWGMYIHYSLGHEMSAEVATCWDSLIFTITLGYLAVDTVLTCFCSFFSLKFLAHHFGSGIAIIAVIFYDNILGYHMLGIITCAECTNIPMHYRWLLVEDFFQEKKLATSSDDDDNVSSSKSSNGNGNGNGHHHQLKKQQSTTMDSNTNKYALRGLSNKDAYVWSTLLKALSYFFLATFGFCRLVGGTWLWFITFIPPFYPLCNRIVGVLLVATSGVLWVEALIDEYKGRLWIL